MPNSTILPKDFVLTTWNDVKPYYDELLTRKIDSVDDLKQFIDDCADISNYMSEDFSRRSIRQSCDTTNDALKKHYEEFIDHIQPEWSKVYDQLNRKINHIHCADDLEGGYHMYMRSVKRSIEIYREENIPLYQELSKLSSQYGEIYSQMTIEHDGKELTLKQAQMFLKDNNRELRKVIFDKMLARKMQDKDVINELLDKQISLRNQIAHNAGFDNFADYQHYAMERFDYSVADVQDFCRSIQKIIVPLAHEIVRMRKNRLGHELQPYDFDVSMYTKQSNECYTDQDDLIDKVSRALNATHQGFGDLILRMNELGQLDLMTRKGKRQGGYCSFMETSDTSFIFMNAATDSYGLMTMIHEAGHAIHHYYTAGIRPSYQRCPPSEICEIGSMAQEFLSLDKLHEFFENKRDYDISIIEKIMDEIMLFPWMAKIDAFQQWLYRNPNHSHQERSQKRVYLCKEFSADFKYSYDSWFDEYDHELGYIWQGQLHIFEYPFYYVEYGIASLAAMAIWRNYLRNPEQGIADYISLLKVGYSVPVPEVFAAGGIAFDFSEGYISELMDFMQGKLEEYREKLE